MSWSIKLHLGSLGSGDCLIVTFPDYYVTQRFNERTTRGPRLPPCVLRRNGDAEASGILMFFVWKVNDLGFPNLVLIFSY